MPLFDCKTVDVSGKYRVAQKVTHHQVFTLNRIKTVSEAKFFINFD